MKLRFVITHYQFSKHVFRVCVQLLLQPIVQRLLAARNVGSASVQSETVYTIRQLRENQLDGQHYTISDDDTHATALRVLSEAQTQSYKGTNNQYHTFQPQKKNIRFRIHELARGHQHPRLNPVLSHPIITRLHHDPLPNPVHRLPDPPLQSPQTLHKLPQQHLPATALLQQPIRPLRLPPIPRLLPEWQPTRQRRHLPELGFEYGVAVFGADAVGGEGARSGGAEGDTVWVCGEGGVDLCGEWGGWGWEGVAGGGDFDWDVVFGGGHMAEGCDFGGGVGEGQGGGVEEGGGLGEKGEGYAGLFEGEGSATAENYGESDSGGTLRVDLFDMFGGE